MTEEEIAELKKLGAQYETAFKEERNHDAAELDEQFHHLITEAAKNPYVLQFSAVLRLHVRRMKYVFFNRPLCSENAVRRRALENHRRF
nr:FCD domain-containing protein [Bacillus licheniformis]